MAQWQTEHQTEQEEVQGSNKKLTIQIYLELQLWLLFTNTVVNVTKYLQYSTQFDHGNFQVVFHFAEGFLQGQGGAGEWTNIVSSGQR